MSLAAAIVCLDLKAGSIKENLQEFVLHTYPLTRSVAGFKGVTDPAAFAAAQEIPTTAVHACGTVQMLAAVMLHDTGFHAVWIEPDGFYLERNSVDIVCVHHLPVGNAQVRLNELASQTDIQLLFDFHTAYVQSNPVDGCGTSAQLFDQLLTGTPLMAHQINQRTFALMKREEPKSPPLAAMTRRAPRHSQPPAEVVVAAPRAPIPSCAPEPTEHQRIYGEPLDSMEDDFFGRFCRRDGQLIYQLKDR